MLYMVNLALIPLNIYGFYISRTPGTRWLNLIALLFNVFAVLLHVVTVR